MSGIKNNYPINATHKLRFYIEGESHFNNKSLLEDFTGHISVAGATCFNKC